MYISDDDDDEFKAEATTKCQKKRNQISKRLKRCFNQEEMFLAGIVNYKETGMRFCEFISKEMMAQKCIHPLQTS